jgi:putative ATP-dependent endonuclease of OLD family
MARVTRVRIRGFLSIDDWVEIWIPEGRPVVLVGENNAGKSNVIRAIDLVLGERWRGNYSPEDHEFFGRDSDAGSISVVADVDGVVSSHWGKQVDVAQFRWSHEAKETKYEAITTAGQTMYMSYATKDQCLCVQLTADRRIRYELSYTNQFTLLSKIMKRFHDRLTADTQRVRELKSHFKDVVTLFRGVEEFRCFEETLRGEIGMLSSNLRYPLDIDFSAYDPSNYFHALRIRPREDEGPRTFDELGTGQEQLLAMSVLYAYAQAFGAEGAGILLLLEEPEAHLHPLAQRWLARRIRDYVAVGIQVVLTTHSPAFLSLLEVEGLILVKKDAQTGATQTKQLSATQLAEWCVQNGAPPATDGASVLPFYETAATEEIKAGFLARAICLVEGPSEALALPEYCRRLGFDPDEHGLAIIPVGGVGNLAKWIRLFTAYGIPTFVIFDNDAGDDAQGQKRTDLLTTIGVPADEHDEVMATEQLRVETTWAVMGVDFEVCMRRYFGDDYTTLDEQAKAAVPGRAGKPLRARAVAIKLTLQADTEGHAKLTKLVAALRAHTLGALPLIDVPVPSNFLVPQTEVGLGNRVWPLLGFPALKLPNEIIVIGPVKHQ